MKGDCSQQENGHLSINVVSFLIVKILRILVVHFSVIYIYIYFYSMFKVILIQTTFFFVSVVSLYALTLIMNGMDRIVNRDI